MSGRERGALIEGGAGQCPARVLVAAVEAGLSKLPAENGGFPAVSAGCAFTYSVSAKRVTSATVRGVDLLANPEHRLVLITKTYLAAGRDGYDVFAGALTPLMDEETALLLSSLVRSRLCVATAANAISEVHEDRTALAARAVNRWRKKSSMHHLKPPLDAHVEGRIVVEK